jgi:hypothetical protein
LADGFTHDGVRRYRQQSFGVAHAAERRRGV